MSRLAAVSLGAQAISRHIGNKTLAATRLYWSRHRVRLGLDEVRAAAAMRCPFPASLPACLPYCLQDALLRVAAQEVLGRVTCDHVTLG